MSNKLQEFADKYLADAVMTSAEVPCDTVAVMEQCRVNALPVKLKANENRPAMTIQSALPVMYNNEQVGICTLVEWNHSQTSPYRNDPKTGDLLVIPARVLVNLCLKPGVTVPQAQPVAGLTLAPANGVVNIQN